ncbi:MAG TPA: hypothetical protein VGH85_13895 [Mycobacteriales bacterium]
MGVERERFVVLVNGVPGAGKTTLSHPLAQKLGLPLYGKDLIKETWADILGAAPLDGRTQRDWNSLFGAAASQTAWNLLAQSPCGGIIESPLPAKFRHHVEAGLANAGVTRPLEIWCDVPLALAQERLRERWPTMHPIHEKVVMADAWSREYGGSPLGLGPVLTVDTSGPVDIDGVAAWCRAQRAPRRDMAGS